MHEARFVRYIAFLAGLAAVALALTPSLVPRPALFQGFLAGLSFGLAYLVAGWLCRLVFKVLVRRRTPQLPRVAAFLSWLVFPRWGWWVSGAGVALYAFLLGALALRWQNDVRTKVEMGLVDGAEVTSFFVASLVAIGIVFGLRWCLRRVAALGRGWTRRVTQAPAYVAAGGLLTGTLAGALVLAVLVNVALIGTDRVYAARNESTPQGIVEPASTYRSAGPGSAVDWGKLGMQGRAFVGGGPTAHQISEVTQQPAKEPVRVYVGEAQTESMEARAALAVTELKRTGGFERGTLLIATPTGSGWLERQAVESLEYLYGGDTAIVSMQYSYQPSWVSFLFHQQLPRESSMALYQAVKREWLAMPSKKRPALLVYGLSLGASGMQSVFADTQNMISGVDGAVFSGPPNNSMPWGTLLRHRDEGSTPWQPVYEAGLNVRWLSNDGDFDTLTGPWVPARIAYLQHGTDAVTWLTPRLIWQKPDWLAGSASAGGRAPDVSDSMVWIPLITYLQATFDMFMGEAVPARHGHNFGDVAVEAWNGVWPSGLDQATVGKIHALMAAIPYEDSVDN
ncbi:alpha/beta-hydrolase family protein [Arthrobacter cryoconiti]|uniref:Alpha/beta-hydrolase family protein n=1 Tax=Arthrobacter cryoconiti TaxID=748907 RepID=A0ABV8R0V7_9MICC|nr:alpha/beta-hydrolase family protein [Arthrobacter cryoconiti]MCC9068593.1 alpha/beta-hydrolase family protein [Arthrobacter cryoconiti]